jgi:hypothetical protein
LVTLRTLVIGDPLAFLGLVIAEESKKRGANSQPTAGMKKSLEPLVGGTAREAKLKAKP